MPILYKFYILLATFYMIYWTNLLIQCPVPVPVFCMFFVSQKIHIKRSTNAIKFYGQLFWNICDFWELESPQTEARGGHSPPGRARGARSPSGLCSPRTLVGPLLRAQGSLYPKKNRVKISEQLELRICLLYTSPSPRDS